MRRDSKASEVGTNKVTVTSIITINDYVNTYNFVLRRRKNEKGSHSEFKIHYYFITASEKLNRWLNLYHIAVDNNTHCKLILHNIYNIYME